MCLFGSNGDESLFELILKSTGMICDCRDYAIFNFLKKNALNGQMNDVYCAAPPHLNGQRFMALQPGDLVCDVFEQCPTNCVCTKQPSTMAIIVNCANTGLIDLPDTLPQVNNSLYKYHLDLSENLLDRLNYRDYIGQLKSIDVSNSSIRKIESKMWEELLNNLELEEIILKDNLLSIFPETYSVGFQGKLDIQNNPISCDCANQWFKSWLVSMGDKIVNPSNLYCSEPGWSNGKKRVDDGNR